MTATDRLLKTTYWQGATPYCPACSHYHVGPCLCPACGRPALNPGSGCAKHGS